jgi:hypothetical protein
MVETLQLSALAKTRLEHIKQKTSYDESASGIVPAMRSAFIFATLLSVSSAVDVRGVSSDATAYVSTVIPVLYNVC